MSTDKGLRILKDTGTTIKRTVTKDNKLINFRGNLTLNELKLFTLAAATMNEDQDSTYQEYTIDVTPMRKTSEHKDFYNYILEVAKSLEGRRIILESKEPGKRSFNMFRLMNKPRYEEGSKLLTVDMDKDIIPYIKPLKDNYTRYEIENLLSLRSSYSARIYELMKMKEYRGFRELTVDELREYCGIEEGEYKAFKDFEKRVLKVAKKEINENTDITISYEKVKSGRRIHRIEFTIKSKDDEKEIWIDYLEQSCNVKEFKEKAGLSNEKLNAAQVIELYGIACEMLDGVEEKDVFEYIRLNYLYGKDKARNIYAYLKKALREDYAKARGQIRFDYYID